MARLKLQALNKVGIDEKFLIKLTDAQGSSVANRFEHSGKFLKGVPDRSMILVEQKVGPIIQMSNFR
jgi:hypothetical protein